MRITKKNANYILRQRGMLSIFLLCFMAAVLLLFPQKVHAADTVWQNDYTYEKDEANKYIKLQRYNGSAAKLTVPAKATIDGTVYTTYLGSEEDTVWNINKRSIWEHNDTLTSLSFEKGIKLGKNLTHLFYGIDKLTSLDLSTFNTAHVTNMDRMFESCSSLTSLDVSSFDTSNVENMDFMFADIKVKSLDLSHFNMKNVVSAEHMFSTNRTLKSIKTPINVKKDFILSSWTWDGVNSYTLYYDNNGKFYKYLPKNNTKSILIKILLPANGSFTIKADDQAYTGKALTPPVKVLIDGTVVDPENYTLSYSNNINPGTATVTVEFHDRLFIETLEEFAGLKKTVGTFRINDPKAGTTIKTSTTVYQITKQTSGSREVAFVKPLNTKAASVTIPATVKIKGMTYKVTSIKANAFKNNKKVKKITIGKNVIKIGNKAFYNCKNLRTIVLKTKSYKVAKKIRFGKNLVKKNNKRKITFKTSTEKIRSLFSSCQMGI